MKRALLDILLAERAAKHPVALVTEIPGGAQALVTEDTLEGDLALDEAALAEIRPMLRRDKSGIIEPPGEGTSRRLFVQSNSPAPPSALGHHLRYQRLHEPLLAHRAAFHACGDQ